jgi:hypothetical protein
MQGLRLEKLTMSIELRTTGELEVDEVWVSEQEDKLEPGLEREIGTILRRTKELAIDEKLAADKETMAENELQALRIRWKAAIQERRHQQKGMDGDGCSKGPSIILPCDGSIVTTLTSSTASSGRS